jgi:hypothetical protein
MLLNFLALKVEPPGEFASPSSEYQSDTSLFMFRRRKTVRIFFLESFHRFRNGYKSFIRRPNSDREGERKSKTFASSE